MSNVSLLGIFAKITRHAEELFAPRDVLIGHVFVNLKGKGVCTASLLPTVPLLDGLEGAVNTLQLKKLKYAGT